LLLAIRNAKMKLLGCRIKIVQTINAIQIINAYEVLHAAIMKAIYASFKLIL
jgi:hypothetical protein